MNKENKQLFKSIDNIHDFENDHWYQRSWEFIYFPLYRFFHNVIWEHIRPGKIKHYYQRMRYGYSYMDCWSIDCHLSDIIPKMIKRMRKNLYGCPGDLYEKYGDDEGHKHWDTILNTIQDAFQIENDILNDVIIDITDEDARERMEKIMKERPELWEKSHLITEYEQLIREVGWKNFQKYFINLWD